MDSTEIKLVGTPSRNGGIEWKWIDDNDNEYHFKTIGDVYYNLNLDDTVTVMGSSKNKYIVDVSMGVQFDWEGGDS